MALTPITLATSTIRQGFTAMNTIISDLSSTDNAKGASSIGIEDSADNVSATNVEDAIAEIYLDHATTRTLAEVFNEDADTTTGLTWGYTGGKVRSDNVIYTITDGTISLTDDATNYIQITPSGTIQRNTTGFTSGYCPIRTVVCAGGLQTASTDQRAWFQSQNISTTTVGEGGTGLTTITDHGILVGSGTDPITPLAAMTNGQLPIGSTGADPVPATLTGTADEIVITNGAGSIQIGIPDSPVFVTPQLTTPTSTDPVFNGSISGTGVKDEDSMSSDSATSLATQQSIKVFVEYLMVGYVARSTFSYADDDQIYIGPGAYMCAGKMCKWSSTLTTKTIDADIGGAPTAETEYYLYLDHSTITSGTALTNANFVWSATAPTWSDAYHGWYNGSDRCIFAISTATVTGNIRGFYHSGNFVSYDAHVSVRAIADLDDTWTDVDMSGCVPVFSRTVFVKWYLEVKTDDALVDARWRVNGSSENLKTAIGLERIGTDQHIITQGIAMTDASQIIEVAMSRAGDDRLGVEVIGWYFGVGL